MARQHVEAVFGPQWVQDRVAYLRKENSAALEHILKLRQELRKHDQTLPDPYDGNAWREWERKP